MLICIILLIALTFTAVASLQTGVMQVRMSGAIEDDMNAFQTAQAGIDFIVRDAETEINTAVALNTPSTVTLSGDTFTVQTGETITVRYERTSDCVGLPPSTKPTSEGKFGAYYYRVYSDVNKKATRRGVAYQRQGLMKMIPGGC